MQCRACNAEVPEGSSFCERCGTPLLRPCPACAHVNSAQANFCAKCGATMNQNAQKFYAAEAGESEEAADNALLDIFACPNCGYVDARPAGTSE